MWVGRQVESQFGGISRRGLLPGVRVRTFRVAVVINQSEDSLPTMESDSTFQNVRSSLALEVLSRFVFLAVNVGSTAHENELPNVRSEEIENIAARHAEVRSRICRSAIPSETSCGLRFEVPPAPTADAAAAGRASGGGFGFGVRVPSLPRHSGAATRLKRVAEF